LDVCRLISMTLTPHLELTVPYPYWSDIPSLDIYEYVTTSKRKKKINVKFMFRFYL